MFKKKKNDDIDAIDDDTLNDDYMDDYSDELYEDEEFDEFLDEDKNDKPLAEKKKEYYVKADDLINEIRKYQESKKQSEDGKGVISEELRIDDIEDMHKILDASKILSDIAIETSL